MRQKLLTIEMNTSDIKICEVVYDSKKFVEILNYLTIPMPADCITSKDIYELETVAYEIKKALSDAKIRTKNCIFVVNSLDIHGRTMVIPPQKNVAQYIELITAKAEAENTFPVSLEHNIITYTLLDKLVETNKEETSAEEDTDVSEEEGLTLEEIIEGVKALEIDDKEKEKRIKQLTKEYKAKNKAKKVKISKHDKKNSKYEVMTYLVPEDYILKFVDLASKLKLNLISIDYVGNAVYRFVSKSYNTDNHLVVYLNDFNTIITVIENGIMKTQRVNHDFSYSILAKFFFERENLFGVHSIEECFDYINSTHFFELTDKDFAEMPSFTGTDIDDFIRARNEVTNLILDFFDKLTSTINQYRQDTSNDIKDIIFINERSSFPNFSESLAEIAHKPVINYEAPDILSKVKDINLESIIGCLGCIISPTNFNIAQSEELKRRQLVTRSTFTVGVISASVLLAYSFSTLFAYQNAQMKNTTLKNQIDNAKEAQTIYHNFVASEDALLQFDTEFEAKTRSQLNDLDTDLAIIESCVPSGKLIIDSIVCTEEQIMLSITADSKSSIAQFAIELENKTYEETVIADDWEGTESTVQVPYFAIIDISSVTDSEDTEGLFTTGRVVTTSISLTFVEPVDETEISVLTGETVDTTEVTE